ncbi:MAG TPA: hypothetical protein VGR70_16445 [Stellaceae bacterium]|nr:hypothetical protein [Stellaceae bacterium]
MSASFPYRNKLANGDLRVRRVLPPSLIPIIGSKSLTRDLDTKDEQIAKARQFAKNAEIQAIIDNAWRQLRGEPEPRYTWPRDPRNPFGGQIKRYPPPEGHSESMERINDAIARESATADRRLWSGTTATVVTFGTLLVEWKKRRTPGKASIAFFESKIKELVAWLKYDTIAWVTDDKLIEYVGHLLEHKKSQTTIKNHVRAIKTMFAFALERKLIRSNPAALVKFTPKKAPRKARRSFTLAERITILTTARKAVPIIRWGNWIAHFSGARIEEIAGAHKRDIEVVDGVHVLRLREDNREEDESLKNEASWRSVPLHSAIIREGFMTYLESIPDGRLFPQIKPGKASKVMSEWLREEVGITDKRAVFHSHRHGFITMSRQIVNQYGDMRIPLEARVAITGHANGERRSVHGSYGEFPITTLKALIERIPDPTAEVAQATGPTRGGYWDPR